MAKRGRKSGQKGGQTGQQKEPGFPSDAGKPGDKTGKEGSGDTAGSARENRTAAGDDLQKAGERIAKAGSGEIDPLIPKTDADSEEDGDVFADKSGAGEPSDDWVEPSAGGDPGASGESGGASGTEVATETGSAGSSSPDLDGVDLPPGMEEEIKAAQEALAKAGIALQEAGVAVANAETDEELAAAEEMLGDARIAVIVAAQGVEILEDDLSEMPDFNGGAIFEDTNAALQDANIALVIATRSILIARTGTAEFPEGNGSGGAVVDGEVAALEDELDESLVIFDGQIGSARDDVLARSTPPETASSGSGRLPESERIPISEQGEIMQMPTENTEDVPEETQVATAEMPDLNQGDIPDPQGDDIVATQLREAAMAESDPELQAKLWEEYKRYKEGL